MLGQLKFSFLASFLASVVMLGITRNAVAVPIDPQLAGTTQYDEWQNFSGANFPGSGSFPGGSMWSPLESNAAGSADAQLKKLANGAVPGAGPYVASASIYFGGFATGYINGGKLAIADSTPVLDLANLVLQIDIGEAFTFDFWGGLPTLNYNGGTQALAANFTVVDRIDTGATVEMPTGPGGSMQEEPIYRNTWLLQWDTQGLGITDFSIAFNAVQHAQLYGVRLDQSDAYFSLDPEAAAVPEPAAISLAGIALIGLGLIRRKLRAR